MKRVIMILCSLLLAVSLTACGVGEAQPPATTPSLDSVQSIAQDTEVPSEEPTEPEPAPLENTTEAEVPKEDTIRSMQITVGNKTFAAALAENDAAYAFIELMQNAPVIINMSDYSGFEKAGSLGTSLPTSNSRITANEGDIILYNSNQIVAFYGSNSWSYTRLGKIDDLSGWKEALGDGDITMTFSIE